MSGHSKWSKVKHQKAVTDAAKGSAFTKASRAITVAVKEGGGITDPEKNYHLRLALDRAREVNMPKDTIEKAIERASSSGLENIESLIYEGYGPGGVALLVEVATDNRNRTASELKYAIERADGSFASTGSVRFLFDRCGVITISKGSHSFDQLFEIALECGASDVVEAGEYVELYTPVQEVEAVKQKLTEKAIPIDNSLVIFRPKSFVSPGEDGAKKNEKLVQALELIDDVQKVYTNLA